MFAPAQDCLLMALQLELHQPRPRSGNEKLASLCAFWKTLAIARGPCFAKLLRARPRNRRPHAASKSRAECGSGVRAKRARQASQFYRLRRLIAEQSLGKRLRAIDQCAGGYHIIARKCFGRRGNNFFAFSHKMSE